MKTSIALLLSTIGLVSGFAPASRPYTRSQLSVTADEDLELTRKVILDSIAATDVSSDGVVDDDDDDGVKQASAPPKQEKTKPKKKKAPQQPAAPVEIDISKLNIVVGVINKAWEHEEADKLFCEEIDVGEAEPRNIASGLRAHYKAEDLQGRRVLILANLKSRKLVGFPSHGMVLCASSDDGKVVFVDPPAGASIGERVMVDGYNGEPATENQVIKKKMLDAIFPDLKTDSDGVACYKGVPLTAGGGPCLAEGGLPDSQVS